jgi:predicted acetyltransferase
VNTTEAAVSLEPVARDSASTLCNLFELYAYDFSEYVQLQIKASGRFELTPGDVWWTREDHFAYFIKLRGELAGFALVRAGSRVTNAPDVMDVAEFFVLRGIRGKGIGRIAAHALFQAFPRAWEIRVRRTNVAAMQFWSSVAESWVGQPVTSSPFSIEGVDWDVLRLVTGST